MRFHEPHICIEGRCNLPSRDRSTHPDRHFPSAADKDRRFPKLPEISTTTPRTYQTPGIMKWSMGLELVSFFSSTEVHPIQESRPLTGLGMLEKRRGVTFLPSGLSGSALVRFWPLSNRDTSQLFDFLFLRKQGIPNARPTTHTWEKWYRQG